MSKLKCISIYTDKKDTSVFDVIIVLIENRQAIIAISISNEANFEGIEYIEKKEIFLYEYDSSYCKEIENQLKKEGIPDFTDIFTNETSLKEQLLQQCLKNKLSIDIELYNSNCIDVKGIPNELSELELKISKFDENNEADGYAIIKKKAITRIYIDYNKYYDLNKTKS